MGAGLRGAGLRGLRAACNCSRFAALAAPSAVTPSVAESSPEEATFSATPTPLLLLLLHRLRDGGGSDWVCLLATSTPASSPAGGCGDSGSGGFGGSTMAAAGRGDSSFKVDTRPCLREGEFPCRGLGAAPSPSLPLFSLSKIWGARFATARPPTCCGAVRGQAPPAPPWWSSP